MVKLWKSVNEFLQKDRVRFFIIGIILGTLFDDFSSMFGTLSVDFINYVNAGDYLGILTQLDLIALPLASGVGILLALIGQGRWMWLSFLWAALVQLVSIIAQHLISTEWSLLLLLDYGMLLFVLAISFVTWVARDEIWEPNSRNSN